MRLAWLFIVAAFVVLATGLAIGLVLVLRDEAGAGTASVLGAMGVAAALIAFGWSHPAGEMLDLRLQMLDLRLEAIAVLIEQQLEEQRATRVGHERLLASHERAPLEVGLEQVEPAGDTGVRAVEQRPVVPLDHPDARAHDPGELEHGDAGR